MKRDAGLNSEVEAMQAKEEQEDTSVRPGRARRTEVTGAALAGRGLGALPAGVHGQTAPPGHPVKSYFAI